MPFSLPHSLIHRAAICLACTMLGVFSTTVLAEEEPETAPVEPPIVEADRQHWSFVPLAEVAPPDVRNSAWVRNEVDRFILARLESEGLTPAPEATREVLLRRLSFDLTGLPPTVRELEEFQADKSADAYEHQVDRLLGSRAYAERWAQHWLDLARFAETDGFEHDHVREEAWRYRDWVIDALDRDLPYDEFIRQQLAGDELVPGNAAALQATGFLLCGPDMPDINLKEERRHMLLNDITATVGSVLLGLQLGCAQCHDHKYDPLSQFDFYRLRAVFEPADVFGNRKAGRVLFESSGKPDANYLMVRGDFRRLGPEVQPAVPRVLNQAGLTISLDEENRETTGRRAALAQWITAADNPLPLRVIVNRLWQFHFGRGLVASSSDFGLMGDLPTHPELLDWLAAELPRRGFSLKAMHRLLVTSATYRQVSRLPNQAAADSEVAQRWQAALEADPENDLLARMSRRRLEGEAIRDAMLKCSGMLSSRQGGRGVMPPLPEELVATLLKNQWKVSPDREDHYRRSIYLFVRRNLRYPLFEAFDRPDTNASCPRRSESTTAPQALQLLNGELSQQLADKMAAEVWEATEGNFNEAVELAWRKALGREPNADELADVQAFRAEIEDDSKKKSSRELLTQLCLTLFNLNEFIYID